jgi:hypothetical protein
MHGKEPQIEGTVHGKDFVKSEGNKIMLHLRSVHFFKGGLNASTQYSSLLVLISCTELAFLSSCLYKLIFKIFLNRAVRVQYEYVEEEHSRCG